MNRTEVSVSVFPNGTNALRGGPVGGTDIFSVVSVGEKVLGLDEKCWLKYRGMLELTLL